MTSSIYFFCTISLFFFVLTQSGDIVYAQDTRNMEQRISKLREDERNLELSRADLQDDIRKLESKSPEYVVYPYKEVGFAVIPKEQFERIVSVQILIGEWTLKDAQSKIKVIVQATKAFPPAARAKLNLIEKKLSETKKQLLALIDQRNRLNSGRNREQSNSSISTRQEIDLTGNWRVEGRGNNGMNWIATLSLTRKSAGNYSGYFDWKDSAGKYSGKENITGTLDSGFNTLTLSGGNVTGNVKAAVYTIKVNREGRALENGIWSGSDGGGKWSATR